MGGRKNVLWLGWVSFFTDVSSEMIFPILPIFLTTVLKANMAAVGFIEGIAESTSALLKMFSGVISDKYRKNKLMVLLGYGFSTVTKPLLAVSTSWTHVLGVRFADRVGKGLRTSPRDALIAASVSRGERGKYFGLHRMMDTLGAILGTIIAATLLNIFVGNFRLIFWLSLIPGTIAILIIIFCVKEKKTETNKDFKFSLKGLPGSYKRFLFVVTVFNLSFFSYAFFILRAQDMGVAIALIPVVYLVYNLVYAGLAMPAGHLSDRIGRRNVLAIGYLLFGITCLGFAFFATDITIWALFALYGLFMAITDGVSRAYVSDVVEEGRRGTALGVYHTIVGVTVFPANFIGGILWSLMGVTAPFIYAFILSGISSVLMLSIVRR
ncbi:MAG: MFS transporter [archaeon]